MRVLLSTYGPRGSVEPLAAFAVRLRELGAEVRVCAPPDEEFTRRLAEVGVPHVPAGRPVRPLVTSVEPGSAAGLAQRAAELMAAQFETVAAAAEGCDALVATGPLVPQVADHPYWAGRVAELGIGVAHEGPTPTTDSLSAALRTALAPETRARAAGAAGTVRTDGTTVAAKLLLD